MTYSTEYEDPEADAPMQWRWASRVTHPMIQLKRKERRWGKDQAVLPRLQSKPPTGQRWPKETWTSQWIGSVDWIRQVRVVTSDHDARKSILLSSYANWIQIQLRMERGRQDRLPKRKVQVESYLNWNSIVFCILDFTLSQERREKKLVQFKIEIELE